MFNALLLEQTVTGFQAGLTALDEAQLPAGDVLARIEYSTINYKDGLAITNAAPIVRQWPMVPGIDGAGLVEHSTDPRWKPGDRFLITGYGVGESHWGCLAEKARLQGDWLIPLPAGMSSRDAMAIGTAGFTAMLAVIAIEQHGVTPAQGEVLVTGAAGGVGSLAIAILARLGYQVVASTGRMAEKEYLFSLGAARVIERGQLSAPGKPLQTEQWRAAIDSVGSHTLANVCAQTRYEGIVAACGLAQGMDFPASVASFILRGITLRGINSVFTSHALRLVAWQRLATILPLSLLQSITQEVSLANAVAVAGAIVKGQVRGRTVVNMGLARP